MQGWRLGPVRLLVAAIGLDDDEVDQFQPEGLGDVGGVAQRGLACLIDDGEQLPGRPQRRCGQVGLSAFLADPGNEGAADAALGLGQPGDAGSPAQADGQRPEFGHREDIAQPGTVLSGSAGPRRG